MVKGLFIVLLTSSFTLTAQQSSQTLVNKIWESTFGQPNEYDWSASTIDNFGDLISTGHSSIDGLNSQLLLVKQDPDGATMWANNFQFTPNTKNYGTAISSDNLGNIFVAGVTNENDLESKNDFIVLKYSSSGSESWHTKINGSGDGSDIPTKIINDNFVF